MRASCPRQGQQRSQHEKSNHPATPISRCRKTSRSDPFHTPSLQRFNASTLQRLPACQAQSSLVKPGKAKIFYFEVQFFKTQSTKFNIQGPFNLLTFKPFNVLTHGTMQPCNFEAHSPSHPASPSKSLGRPFVLTRVLKSVFPDVVKAADNV